MSVRRLADETVQPESFAFSKANQAWAEKKMAEYPPGRQQSAVIPVLWRAQEQEGWISRAAIETIAKLLDMPYIRVLEVATFYTQFLLRPVGTKAHILICGTTPCMLRGAEDLREVCQHKINHAPFETNAEGTMSWEEVECLGACVNAPMVMIGNDTYEDLTVESFETLVDKFAAGKGSEVKPGPQVERQFGAAEGGQTTLLEKPTAKRTYKPFPPPPAPAPAPGAASVPAAAAPAAKPAEAPKAPVAATRLFEASAGQPDDLKLISGVGPVLEGKLNAIGITTWAQVAALKEADIAKLEDHLAFPGRVARDEWIKQAKALAKGGVEEYRKVFGKDPR